ncbi:MAG: hypothetical protein ABIO51_07430 [Solirubrobacteraceae bacterium]
MSEQPPTSSAEDPLALVDALLAEVQTIRSRWEHVDSLLASMEENGPLKDDARAGDATAHDPARQMALELARSGRSREEIEVYLEQTFGLRADASLLDSVFADPGN